MQNLFEKYQQTRQKTIALTHGLSDADMTVQSMPDASPTKWHLAHTTWFFETFLLMPNIDSYQCFNPQYAYLFNSYYESVGERQARQHRGMMTRPCIDEILEYRHYVDKHMQTLFKEAIDTSIEQLIQLGINHEQQHQELLQTDILHLFSLNPLNPSYKDAVSDTEINTGVKPDNSEAAWLTIEKGLYSIGIEDSYSGFYFDNEGPQHQVYLEDYSIATKLITNAEWIDFIENDGYLNPLYWLSDGWSWVNADTITAPFYWTKKSNFWYQFGQAGLREINPDQPVRHISYYEADAYVNWRQKNGDAVRLPTEFEWEIATKMHPEIPLAFNSLWQWTQSPYQAYPRFKISPGAVGEYNGKFMSNQYVLRGSSFASSDDHSRSSYRNFFYPHQRWQFTGLRLAKDGHE